MDWNRGKQMKYRVCRVEDIPPGEKRTYSIKNVPIVVVHSQQGQFYAVYGRCPHQHGALGEGVLGGQTVAAQPGEAFQYIREGEILRCPWHGFSFDVTTGACLAAPERLRVKTYPLLIDERQIFLDV
jgi:nitrite reductase (NADH) small subunit